MTRPEPTLYGNSECWSFIVGKNPGMAFFNICCCWPWQPASFASAWPIEGKVLKSSAENGLDRDAF